MRFTDLRHLLLKDHLGIYLPWEPLPEGGWKVVVWPSDYHPEGWAIRVTCPHPVINGTVAGSFSRSGFWVQWSAYDPRMEAWPLPAVRSAPSSAP